ncbi:MAG TPA: alpha/beta fold hydrolase [Candidatus Binataceae bacterium]|nr:alpha/beta fold hydrolase [Candidatus Binataceae bacterium]
MKRILHTGSLLLAILFIAVVARLIVLQNGGPAHSSGYLPGQIPATMYMPGGDWDPFIAIFPPPPAKRPPAVVLVHGFTSDRQNMSTLARRIAENGYAVLAIDLHGHGENRNPFSNTFLDHEELRKDIAAAVKFLRESPFVDGSRIVVMGHSMGAGASLDYAGHDPNLKGSVMISGGWSGGPNRPANALFIFGENDPKERIQDTSAAIAANLAGVPNAELGKRYGDFGKGDAVEAIQIPKVDHVQILYSPEAAETIMRWLDSVFGTARTGAIDTADPRVRLSRIALLLFVILLVPLGRAAGSIAPKWQTREDRWYGAAGLAILAVAALAAMPLVAFVAPASFVPLVIGDIQSSWLAVTGIMIAGGLLLAKQIDRQQLFGGFSATLAAAAIAFAVIYVAEGAISVILHQMALTPERLMAMILASSIMLPFWIGFEFLVRRGGIVASTVQGLIGRALILGITVAGAFLGVLPFVIVLIVPILAILFAMMEVFAASAYSNSRNLLLIAIVETAWLAWTMAATNPITFMF